MTGQSALARRADDNIYTQLRFNRWADVLERPRPTTNLARLDWQIGQVLAFAATGKLREAQDARREFDVLAAKGDRAEALALWRRAVAAQVLLTKQEGGMLPWVRSVRESLGAALLMIGDPKAAEQVFRDDLKDFPEAARPLYGLWRALQEQGRAREATAIEKRFRKAWRHADIELRLEEF
jgi:hypothetical protein